MKGMPIAPDSDNKYRWISGNGSRASTMCSSTSGTLHHATRGPPLLS
jgi:hypothetical protein